jgi:asparagine synthase (glutamine-hydrolysing)
MEAVLADIMRGHLISDVPMGALLSGGVDSSAVVALMAEAGAGRPHTFSIGYEDSDFDESDHAAAVAHHLGTVHHQLRVNASDALRVIPRLADIYDEPFADGSQVPTVLVSEMARREVTVVLSGDGGDELFGGYDRYWERSAQWNRVKALPLQGPLAALLGHLPLNMVTGPLRRLGLLADAGQSLPVIRQLLRLPVIDPFYGSSQFVWPRPPVSYPFSQAHPQTWPELGSAIVPDALDRMQYADAMTVLPDDLLVKVDRASMAVGLEARVPLLDHRLVDLACRIPVSMRRRGNAAKWPLRLVLDKRVPAALLDRPKMGFHMPMTRWMKGPLRPWAEELLAPARLASSGLFDVPAIRAEWMAFKSGGDGRTYDAIWGVLMAQAWLERWEGG